MPTHPKFDEKRAMTNSANGEWLRLSLYVSCTAIVATFLSGKLLAQAVERSDWSIELVDPKVLRVCADPHNMPFSTDRGEGFENKLAELLADKLGKGLSYSWYPQATGFVRNTLAAHKCDVIMGIPQGDDLVQVTNPLAWGAWTRWAILASRTNTSASWPGRLPATTWRSHG